MSTIIYTYNGQVLVDVSDNKWLAEPLYTITYSTVSNGTITGQANAHYGDTITITATADTGYALDYITVNGVAIVGNTFTMPRSNVTISAVFVEAVVEEVTIGTQTWKTYNLDIDDGLEGIVTVNGNVYYTQPAAIRVAATVDGWHLPSQTEFNTLMSYVGSDDNARKLASTTGWLGGGGQQGTDEYGFNALPLGYYYSNTQSISAAGYSAYFWTSNYEQEQIYPDEYQITRVGFSITYDTYWLYGIRYENETIYEGTVYLAPLHSVRLIKDT